MAKEPTLPQQGSGVEVRLTKSVMSKGKTYNIGRHTLTDQELVDKIVNRGFGTVLNAPTPDPNASLEAAINTVVAAGVEGRLTFVIKNNPTVSDALNAAAVNPGALTITINEEGISGLRSTPATPKNAKGKNGDQKPPTDPPDDDKGTDKEPESDDKK